MPPFEVSVKPGLAQNVPLLFLWSSECDVETSNHVVADGALPKSQDSSWYLLKILTVPLFLFGGKSVKNQESFW